MHNGFKDSAVVTRIAWQVHVSVHWLAVRFKMNPHAMNCQTKIEKSSLLRLLGTIMRYVDRIVPVVEHMHEIGSGDMLRVDNQHIIHKTFIQPDRRFQHCVHMLIEPY